MILRRLYDKTLILAQHRHGPLYLFLIAFIQASFFPIPVDAMLIPMALANRKRAIWLAGIATVGSVAGAVGGYMIGAFLYDSIGAPLLAFDGKAEAYDHFQTMYQQYGLWIVGAGGLTPLPFKVITIASGAMHLNILTFILASLASRGLRFFAEGILIYFVGDAVRDFIERYFIWVTTGGFVLVVGGFIALGLLL